MTFCLGIDYGEKYIGFSVVEQTAGGNIPRFLGTMEVQRKPIETTLDSRALARRARRTRKTKRRRLKRLGAAFVSLGLPSEQADELLRYCSGRGFRQPAKEDQEQDQKEMPFALSRDEFLTALTQEIKRLIASEDQERVLAVCRRHLRREIRPMRVENRKPSKCAWEGCDRNVRRAKNARRERLQQALFSWLTDIIRRRESPAQLWQALESWIDRALASPKRVPFKALYTLVPEPAFQKHKAVYEKNIRDILQGESAGRTRFCCEHSNVYIQYAVTGRTIPTKTDFSPADVGRIEQKIFTDLWRYLEARVLPLVGQIDEIVVERVAFDVLRGYHPDRKQDKSINEAEAYKHYQQGPAYGFQDRREMLTKEFDGRCAYCGKRSPLTEVEHLLPQSRFPFDSYLNIVPACRACNARKGSRTAAEAGMTIHDDAYEAYCKYVGKRKIDGFRARHPYHDTKKGLLNRMRHAGSALDAEQALAMILSDLTHIGNSQQAPRPLARYLAQCIETRTGKPCAIRAQSGRLTALYRTIMLPEYAKDHDDDYNHAIDAAILACKVPSFGAWSAPLRRVSQSHACRWRERVLKASPLLFETRPAVPADAILEIIPGFETLLPGGYVRVRLSSFNWNKKNQATCKLDPVGTNKITGKDQKRASAAEFHKELKDLIALVAKEAAAPPEVEAETAPPEAEAGAGKPKKRKKKPALKMLEQSIRKVTSSGLRTYLLADMLHADTRLLEYLRVSINTEGMGTHPNDLNRRKLLDDFRAGKNDEIPQMGISLTKAGGNFTVPRKTDSQRLGRFQAAHSSLQCLYVGYQREKGVLEEKLVIFKVNRIFQVTEPKVKVPNDSPLVTGRPLGSQEKEADFSARWVAAFREYCRTQGIERVERVTQGCVIERDDGSCFYVQNLDLSKNLLTPAALRDIKNVFRSPLCAAVVNKQAKLLSNSVPYDHASGNVAAAQETKQPNNEALEANDAEEVGAT